jgi:hypothetical protein
LLARLRAVARIAAQPRSRLAGNGRAENARTAGTFSREGNAGCACGQTLKLGSAGNRGTEQHERIGRSPRGSPTASTSESRGSGLKTQESTEPARMKHSEPGNESSAYENP